MDNITELFCFIDDFCQQFEPALNRHLITSGAKKRKRQSQLSLSELMTLAVLFHQLRFRQFKIFYLHYACRHLRSEFPNLPSYNRCVELLPRCVVSFAALFEMLKGECDGISIADATSLAVFNFVVNVMAGIVAYCLSDNKPTLSLIRVNILVKA